uniref:Uncharacterized protein n=1 Tax=Clostridium perfringens TaxID=1502 RepID=F7J089_CLOPF|nr:hypothetical protein [Clostridium perfringens]
MQLLFRIDFSRSLSMYSIMNGLNVEVYNNGKKVRDNFAVSEDNPDYEKDYEIPDVILDVFSKKVTNDYVVTVNNIFPEDIIIIEKVNSLEKDSIGLLLF